MPIPVLITELSTTANSNSPAGSESPVDGDNFIRALSAFVASLAAGSATNGYTTPYLLLAGGTVSGNLVVTGTSTFNGAVTLGDAQADTVTIGGVAFKSATGNYTIPAPSSGTALTVTGVAGSNTIAIVTSGGADGRAVQSFSNTLTTSKEYTLGIDTAGGTSKAFELRDITRGAIPLSVSTTGNVTIAAPSSGVGLTVSQFGSTSGIRNTVGSGNTSLIEIEQSGVYAWTLLNTATTALFAIAAGGVNRLTITTDGRVTIPAPGSGVGLTQTGFAGSNVANFVGGTSGQFSINTTGVPYATSAHNNAGAVTGTTNQYFCSGTYTPTVTNATNTSARSGNLSTWARIGNSLIIGLNITIDPTTADTATQVSVTLPPVYSGNFAGTSEEANGVLMAKLTSTDANIPSTAYVSSIGSAQTISVTFQTGTDVASYAWTGTVVCLIV